MTAIKLCLVTEFEQANFFQWKIALSYYHELEVTSAVMSETILKAYPLDDERWDVIRKADVVFVYCTRHDLNWEWYKLPLLVKEIMNEKAKMVCQFDSEFLWLWYPHHHSWKKKVVWARNKTPKQFFKETKVMEVADAYIVLANKLLKRYTSKPVHYLPLPQLTRHYSLIKASPSRRDMENKSKRTVVLRHSVESASIEETLKEVIVPSGVPVTIFTTTHTDSEEKLKMLRNLPQPRRSVVYGSVPRDVYMEFLERGYAAVDDNEGYYGWSRFAMECALAHIPCVGSTRAVKEFFPKLYTKPKDYEKQRELLKRLYNDKTFWLKMAKTGKRRVLKKLDTSRLASGLTEIITSIMSRKKKSAKKKSAKSKASLEWERYREFIKEWKSYHKVIPSRPPKDGLVMDSIHKRIITQKQWDFLYGKWRKFIEGYEPSKPKPKSKPKMREIVIEEEKPIEEPIEEEPTGEAEEEEVIAIGGPNGTRFSDEGELLRPLLVIMSPRDIPWIKEKYDKIDYVDVLWIKHYPTNETVDIAKRYFLERDCYTHLILTADDTAPEYDGIAKLMADVAKYDFPVVTGCCSSDAIAGGMHLNLTFTPVVRTHPSKLSQDIYENLRPQFRELGGLVKVWFQGNACSVMRRDVIREAFGWTWSGRFGADIRFSYECAQRNISTYADLRVWMHHSKYPRYGMFKLSLQSGNTKADDKAKGRLIFRRAVKSIPIEEPAKVIKEIPSKLRELMKFFYSKKPKRKLLKICLVTEFEQEKFPWQKALLTYRNGKYDAPYRARKVGTFERRLPMDVSSVVMNPSTLSMYKSNHSYWEPIKKAHIVFVYCAHRNLNWDSLSWYKLPLLVKEMMNKRAKLICQFAHEFLWLWHPNHVYQNISTPWTGGKTPEEFLEESGVFEVADGYFTVIDDPPWRPLCKKPIFYMPLPYRNQYVMRRRHRHVTKALLIKTTPKRIGLIYHSVRSASIKHTVRNLINPTGLPVVVFLTTESHSPMSQADKMEFIRENGLPRKRTLIRENLCRKNFIDQINRCWIAIDDNEGYYGWSRFAYECALASVPCIGSTRAVKQFFPQLHTEHKDYTKQKELIERLEDEDFYVGIIAAGSRRSRYQLGNTRKSVEFITCARFELDCPMGTLSRSQIRHREEEDFINFLMRIRNLSAIPSRPPTETQRIFDQNLRRIIGQDEWDRKYGMWTEFINNRSKYGEYCREAKRRLAGKT